MMNFDRRDLLLGAMAATAATGATRLAAAPAVTAKPLVTPPEILEGLVKLRGSLDGRIGIWWMRGPRYGVTLDAKITPMFDNLVTSFQKFTRRADGNFDVAMVELSYYTDIETGEWLHEWRNPFTGEMNEIEHIVFGPITSVLTAQGMTPPKQTPGARLEVKPKIGIVAQKADDVWIGEDTSATIHSSLPGRKTYQGNDLATYHGSLAAIRDPKQAGVDATIHYQSVTNWRTWMKMGDTPGHLMARSVGRKVWSVDDLPDALLAIARKAHPEVIRDPAAALAAPQPDASFQR